MSTKCNCSKCQQSLPLKSVGIQTDENPSFHASPQSLPRPLRANHSIQARKIVKIEPIKGDLDEQSDPFDDCDLSSIEISNSHDSQSKNKSTSKDETIHFAHSSFSKDELTESTRVKNLFSISGRQTPESMYKSRKMMRKKARTPSLYSMGTNKFEIIDKEAFELSYEQTKGKMNYQEKEEFRQCVENLMMIEKQSLQQSFRKQMSMRRY
jgi:hypothetical protein